MDKFHKLILVVTIMRLFDLTIAVESQSKGRDMTSYQINVPGKQPITIVEDDKQVLSPYSDYSGGQYQFTKRVSNGPTYEMQSLKPMPFSVLPPVPEANDKNGIPNKNSATLLEKFLQKYQNHPDSDIEAIDMEGAINVENLDNYERKNYRPMKNSGWVSLDPVPTYTAGKVYRWQSNAQKYRPARPSYSNNHWNDEEDDDRYYQQHRPSSNRPSYHHNEDRYPEMFDDDEGYHVPAKPFGSTYPGNNGYRPSNDRPYASRPSSNRPYYGEDDDDDRRYYSHKKRPHNEIITDNRPPNFPKYDTHRYGSSGSYTDRKPETYPGNGEGKWVLVSTTKGLGNDRKTNGRATSRKGKSKNITRDDGNASSVSTVLHVLPNPNSRNITTSNGEVIEVAESGRGHKNPFAEPTTRRPISTTGTRRQFNKKRLQIVGTAQKPAENSAPAVLAAVGAGLLPASLAIVAPMVLGRRRRDVPNDLEGPILGYKYLNTTDLLH